MDFSSSKIYNITKKSDINYLIGNIDKSVNIGKYNRYIHPYVDLDNNNKPKRLIERIDRDAKHLNRVLYNHLRSVDTPDWHFSKRGKSYIDNALYHVDNDYVLTLDLSKFFPNTSREMVYQFFLKSMNMPSDVAGYVANMCCVDLDLCSYKSDYDREMVEQFMVENSIRQRNHLISGASTSSILSFLVHYDMFNEIKHMLKKHEKMSVYVDDITISSNTPIKKSIVTSISEIVYKYGHRLSKGKTKFYGKDEYKKATGVIITPNNKSAIPNSKRHDIIQTFGLYKESEYTDNMLRERLKGLLLYARSIEKNAFPRIYQIVNN